MALITYLDSNCLIAVTDAEPQRRAKVQALLGDPRHSLIYSPFTVLETLTLALHYGKKAKAQYFRQHFNQCIFISDNLGLIMQEAHRQAERYGVASVDACHLAAAIVVSADEFYTFEKPTKPMFRTQEIKVISLL